MTPAVAAVSAIIAVASATIAWFGIRNTRAVARQKATLDLIEKVESTEYYRQLTSNFTQVKRRNGFNDLIAPSTEVDRRARLQVIDYLNHYELISIGISNNILDEAIYRQWMGSAFVENWNAASDWIQRQRWKHDDQAGGWSYDPRPYGQYQRVACRWSLDARRLDAGSTPPPAAPGAPSDSPLPRLSEPQD